MRRLYIQIYLTLVAALVILALLASALWYVSSTFGEERRWSVDGLAETVAEEIPPESSQPQAMLDVIASEQGYDITLRSRDGEVLAFTGRPLWSPGAPREDQNTMPRHRHFAHVAIQLADQRWLLVRPHRRHSFAWVVMPILLALALAIAAFPFVRRLTRRLERLQRRVDALGGGDLSARVQVEGRDEVARLAASFNAAAERIERLVEAQSATLASASHELRSPLARIRLAVTLLDAGRRPELEQRIENDIAELDDLIDELLLASQLRAQPDTRATEKVELLSLLRTEGERVNANVDGVACSVPGEERLLRRLLRNLFENAQRYAQGTQIDARVAQYGDGDVVIEVLDRGPGIAPEQRERVFEPFYRPPGMAEDGKGVGLGLALVRQIAARHGATVRCLGRDGGGSCFAVRFSEVRAKDDF